MLSPVIIKNLRCPRCWATLVAQPDCFQCAHCSTDYPLAMGIPQFAPVAVINSGDDPDGLVSRLKSFFKKYSRFYNFLYYVFGGLFVGPNAQQAIKHLHPGSLILNLGSGIKRIRPDVVNIDFYPFPNVDLVADIARLPFADHSVDAVINEFVLEHVPDPVAIVAEIKRVLKPGGLVYLSAPFIEGFHSSPHDYGRWTKAGLQNLMADFQLIESGIRSGPTSALLSILNEWLAVLLSFGWRPLEQLWLIFFTIITSPLKLLDYFMRYLPNAENISFAFYYLGKKK